MKKLFATSLLLMCLFVGFTGNTSGAIEGPGGTPVCHDKSGNWNPQDKRCDQESCGCFFHQIEEFFVDLFS